MMCLASFGPILSLCVLAYAVLFLLMVADGEAGEVAVEEGNFEVRKLFQVISNPNHVTIL